jgi:hypothetical protein
MKRVFLLVFAAIAFSQALCASPISLVLTPASIPVTAGQTVNVVASISGLGNPPSVGSFDLSVAFDPALVSPAGVAFGSFLGDVSLGEAITDFTSSPGVFEFAEVSLLTSSQLDALQGAQSGSFGLAAVSFTGLTSGTVSFGFSTGVVDDSFGNKLVEIPEPSTLALTFTFVWGMGLRYPSWRSCKSRRPAA